MAEQTGITMEDVFMYLEGKRLPAEQEAKGLGWWVRSSIEDLRNGNPDKALDILEGSCSSYTMEQWMRDAEKIERAQALLKFLEKQFGREGMSHDYESAREGPYMDLPEGD